MNIKTILFFIFVILFNSSVRAQYTQIPDSFFEQELISRGLDEAPIDGQVLTANIQNVVIMNISNSNITDFSGIEDFSNLEQLWVYQASINYINLSSNKKLRDVQLQGQNLDSINVSQMPALEKLNCLDNNLNHLDLSGDTSLFDLNCKRNTLNSLDLKDNINLIELDCQKNDLNQLNLCNNIRLKTLICNDNELETLSIENLTALDYLACSRNYLSSIDLKNNTNLRRFNCYGNQLTEIDLGTITSLEDFNCLDNDLKSLVLGLQAKLETLNCGQNHIRYLDLSQLSKLTQVAVFDNELTFLDLNNQNNENLTSVRLEDNPYLFCVKVDNPSNFGDQIYESNFRHDDHVTFSSAPCEHTPFIKGIVFLDENQNGIKESFEEVVENAPIYLNDTLVQYSDENGKYLISTDEFSTPLKIKIDVPQKLSCDGSLVYSGYVTFPISNQFEIQFMSDFDFSLGNDFGIYYEDVLECNTFCGFVFNDKNHNGRRDFDEVGIHDVTIKVDDIGLFVTDESGLYCGEAVVGSFLTLSIDTLEKSLGCNDNKYWNQTFPAENEPRSVQLTSHEYALDFGVNKNNDGYDLAIRALRPYPDQIGENYKVFVDFKSIGDTPDSCDIVLEFESTSAFLYSSLPPSNVEFDKITWSLNSWWNKIPESGSIEMIFNLDNSVNYGDVLTWEAKMHCGSPANFSDNCSKNDSLIRSIKLEQPLASKNQVPSTNDLFNSIGIYANGVLTDTLKADQTQFSTVINYRNETEDTVYSFYIIDTLCPFFDPLSVSRPFSNYPYVFKITNQNVLIWEFNNVNIPPYSDDPLNCYGFVQYHVSLKEIIDMNTSCLMSVSINENFTNNTLLTNNLVISDIVTEDYNTQTINLTYDMLVYPNPNSHSFIVRSPKLNDSSVPVISIYKPNGYSQNLEFERSQTNELHILDIENIDPGTYICVLKDGEVTIGRTKFIKL